MWSRMVMSFLVKGLHQYWGTFCQIPGKLFGPPPRYGSMTPEHSNPNWNQRFTVQAEWTKPLRDFLIEQTGMRNSSSVLEVGSGTGVILRETAVLVGNQPVGIDINLERLRENKAIKPEQVV